MTLHIKIRNHESGGYHAACVSLPGCTTRAQTRDEARRKLGEAIVGYLASVGNTVPDHLVNNVVEI